MKAYNKYFAELLGTFALAMVVRLSLGNYFPVSTPILAALTLGLFVYTVGHLSGTHINPAITLGALSIRKINLKEAAHYWVAQFIGGGLAAVLSYYFVGTLESESFFKAGMVDVDLMAMLSEALGAFFFAFGVAAVIYGRVPKDFTGVVVGGSLLMGISIAATYSNGVLNPAVALGIHSFTLAYLCGPLVGAVLGMWAYKLLSSEKR